MPVICRTALPSDIDAVMRIEKESFLPGLQEDKDLYLKRISAFPEGFPFAVDLEENGSAGDKFNTFRVEDNGRRRHGLPRRRGKIADRLQLSNVLKHAFLLKRYISSKENIFYQLCATHSRDILIPG